VQLKQNSCHKGTQRAQGQELIFFNFCDLCDLSWPLIFGSGLPRYDSARVVPRSPPKNLQKFRAFSPSRFFPLVEI
jgi:hypothetical protein